MKKTHIILFLHDNNSLVCCKLQDNQIFFHVSTGYCSFTMFYIDFYFSKRHVKTTVSIWYVMLSECHGCILEILIKGLYQLISVLFHLYYRGVKVIGYRHVCFKNISLLVHFSSWNLISIYFSYDENACLGFTGLVL